MATRWTIRRGLMLLWFTKALERSVETLGLWIVTFSFTFVKSVNQSSIKPCLSTKFCLAYYISRDHIKTIIFYQWRQRRQYVRVTPSREARASPSRLKRNRERELAVETIFFAFFRRAEVSAWQERRAIHAREKWCLYARKIIPTVPAVIYERGCPVDKRPHRGFLWSNKSLRSFIWGT